MNDKHNLEHADICLPPLEQWCYYCEFPIVYSVDALLSAWRLRGRKLGSQMRTIPRMATIALMMENGTHENPVLAAARAGAGGGTVTASFSSTITFPSSSSGVMLISVAGDRECHS